MYDYVYNRSDQVRSGDIGNGTLTQLFDALWMGTTIYVCYVNPTDRLLLRSLWEWTVHWFSKIQGAWKYDRFNQLRKWVNNNFCASIYHKTILFIMVWRYSFNLNNLPSKLSITTCPWELYLNGDDEHEHRSGLDLISSKFRFCSVFL